MNSSTAEVREAPHTRRWLHALAVGATFYLVSTRACTPAISRVVTNPMDGEALGELAAVGVLGASVIFLLALDRRLGEFLRCWRHHSAMLALVVLSLASIGWSVSPGASLYKAAMFALATLVGSYIGFRSELRGVLEQVFVIFVVVLVASALVAVLAPGAGRMLFYPYNGSWRGLFWHRNHMGIFAALASLVFLFRLVDSRKPLGKVVFSGASLVSGIVMVWLARSATGIIVLAAGGAMTLMAWGWYRVRSRLQQQHRWGLLALVAVALAGLPLSLGKLLGLLGRDTSLTGRIPMWRHVFQEYVQTRPVLGFGMGAFWNTDTHRYQIQRAVGWLYPVEIGDNGWLDVLLNLGFLGLSLFVAILGVMFWRNLVWAFKGQRLLDCFPLVFLTAACLANVSFSLFFEIECGVWLVLVALAHRRQFNDT